MICFSDLTILCLQDIVCVIILVGMIIVVYKVSMDNKKKS